MLSVLVPLLSRSPAFWIVWKKMYCPQSPLVPFTVTFPGLALIVHSTARARLSVLHVTGISCSPASQTRPHGSLHPTRRCGPSGWPKLALPKGFTPPPPSFVLPLRHDSHIAKTDEYHPHPQGLLSTRRAKPETSCMAQRKRAGLITRRSLDRNELQLGLFFCIYLSFFSSLVSHPPPPHPVLCFLRMAVISLTDACWRPLLAPRAAV